MSYKRGNIVICATLVLCDVNARRNEILDRCKAYNTKREEREQIVAQRRKQRLAEEISSKIFGRSIKRRQTWKHNQEEMKNEMYKRNIVVPENKTLVKHCYFL